MSGVIRERRYTARVMRFRAAVYGPREGLTNGCRLLLLRLSDSMDGHCKVSIPRSALCAELGVAPARITEWIHMAKGLGLLDTVRRGRPGVTAVYQGLIPKPEVRQGVPTTWYARADQAEVREGVPQNDPTWYATAVPQEVVQAVGSADVVCECHGMDDCATLSDHREASA